MTAPALEVRSAVLTFGGLVALHDVGFAAAEGEIFGIVGPNGAGKSALLNCITGVYRMDSGSALYRNRPIERLKPHQIAALGIARTFQSTDYFKHLAVEDFLMLSLLSEQPTSIVGSAFALPSVRRRDKEGRAEVRAFLEEFGLGAYADRTVGSLPYGVQKRIDIVRALVAKPSLILMDEPTSGMPVAERGAVGDIIRHARARSVTVVVVDHDVDFVRRECDRLLVMNQGLSLGIGSPQEMLAREDVLQAYVGV